MSSHSSTDTHPSIRWTTPYETSKERDSAILLKMRFTQSTVRLVATASWIVGATTVHAFQPAFPSSSHRTTPSTNQRHARSAIHGPLLMLSQEQDRVDSATTPHPHSHSQWNQWGIFVPTLSALAGWALASQVAWAAVTAPNMVPPESTVAAPGEKRVIGTKWS